MKLVVVTPVKDLIANNRTEYFERLTNSVQRQTHKDITHLLIAGQSSDDTNAYIEKYSKEYPNVQISHQQTKNKWHAMNLGLQVAEGDYIQFLEDDDFYAEPTAVRDILTAMEKEEAYFSFGPVWLQPKVGNRFLRKVKLGGFYRGEPFALASMVCNMEFAKEMLSFDDELKYIASAGFILCALLSGAKGVEIKKALLSISYNKLLEDELNEKMKKYNEEMLQIDELFFLGFAGMTHDDLKLAVEKGTVPIAFLDAFVNATHPFFKEYIQKEIWNYQHKFDKFVEYAKAGYNKIYIPLIGMGDALIFSSVARKIFEHTGKKVLVGHKDTEIFKNNPYIELTDIVSDTPETMGLEDIKFLKDINFDIQYVTYWLSRPIENNKIKFFLTYPEEHVIARSYAVCGYSGKIELKPEIYLTDEEKSFGRFFPKDRKQIAIMSSAISPRKQYPYFQQIIDTLKDEYDFIQIGAPEDKLLKNVKENMTGTLTLRQTAGVLYNSDLFVGEIGGLMHMARAVDCPAVIAYSSAEPDYMARYIANINIGPENKCLLSQTGVCDKNCNPCINKDLYCCCRTISVEKMIAGIREQLKRGKENLPVEVVEVKADPFEDSIREYLRRYNHIFKLDNL